MIRRKRLLMFLLILSVVGLSIMDHWGVFGFEGNDTGRYRGAIASITYAADGDTVDIALPDGNRNVTRIRLWGVDCPEIAHSDEEQDAHFGREATNFVRQAIVGQRVRLELDPNRKPRDKYGRLLAYVYLADTGEMLNEMLIERGYGYADRRFRHALKHRFVKIEKRARRSEAGLWASVRPEQMPGWRQRMDAAGAR